MSGKILHFFSAKLDMTISPARIVRLSLEFIYRGRVSIPKMDIKEVIQCADYLQIDSLKIRCAEFLRDFKLDHTNCVSMCTLASMYNLDSLYDESNRILKRKFKEVILKDDILQLMPDSLKFLIMDKNLRYVGQLEIFKLLVRWTEYADERKPEFYDLFNLIDLNDITTEQLNSIVKPTSLVSEDSRCLNKILEHERYLLGMESANCGIKDVIIVVSGQKWSSFELARSTAVYGYIIQDNRWVRLSNLPRRMSGQLSVKSDSDLYILGREDNSVFTRLYKLPRNEVKEYWLLCSLEQPRTVSDEIYATVFCKEKLVTVRRDNVRLFVCSHNPNAPNETSVKNLMFLRTAQDIVIVRMCCYKDRYVFILIMTSRFIGGQMQNKTVVLDMETNILDLCETKITCTGEILYLDGEKVHLETPGKRFSHIFDMEKRKWSSLRKGLPALPDRITLKNCKSVKFKEDLFLIGGTSNKESRDIYRLRNRENRWEKMAEPPTDVSLKNVSCALFPVPRELLRCPYDCTHCAPKFITPDYLDDALDSSSSSDSSLYGAGYDDSDDFFDNAAPFFFW